MARSTQRPPPPQRQAANFRRLRAQLGACVVLALLIANSAAQQNQLELLDGVWWPRQEAAAEVGAQLARREQPTRRQAHLRPFGAHHLHLHNQGKWAA